ncbi:MAG: RagB/SusD family nutrient uptake outer membrane protein, partial [Bacteroidales bacterium]|nr:RagB/SusD family nutrient uptake outer membrane protein [Bacteroidales bacterium]
MKSIQTYLSGALLLSLFACSDVLDVRDASLINPAIWDSEQSATLYINNLYNEMPASTIISSSSNPFGAHAQFTDETLGSNKYVNGEYTYSDIAVFNDTYYGKIRRINIALEKMETSSLAGDAYNRIVGQAYFLRAWAYWNLVAVYGGVPYITRSVNPYVDDSTTLDPPRNKTSECISYLCDDLDDAIATLPASVTAYQNGTSQYARVTRAAAAALKGRILLFYASPQFNPTNNPARWEAAYQANRFADSLAKADGYALMVGTTDPLTGGFASIFLTEGNQNKEVLFSKAYDVSVSRTHGWENAVRPYVAGLSGGMT